MKDKLTNLMQKIRPCNWKKHLVIILVVLACCVIPLNAVAVAATFCIYHGLGKIRKGQRAYGILLILADVFVVIPVLVVVAFFVMLAYGSVS